MFNQTIELKWVCINKSVSIRQSEQKPKQYSSQGV